MTLKKNFFFCFFLSNLHTRESRAIVGNDTLELGAFGHVLELGASEWQTKQRLGGKDDERFPELAVNLATEDVEIVCRAGDIADLHVGVLDLATLALLHVGDDEGIVIAHLQETRQETN